MTITRVYQVVGVKLSVLELIKEVALQCDTLRQDIVVHLQNEFHM